MLKNYKFFGDESGTDRKSRICAIAGLVGPEKLWQKFDRNWIKVLAAEGVPYFHAVECERASGEFHGLDVMKRGRIVDRLVQVIMESPLEPYSYGLVRHHFDAWNEDDRKWFTSGHPDNPYYLVLNHLFVKVSHSVDQLDKSEKVEFLFEQQKEFEPEARIIFGEFKANPQWPNHERMGEIFFSGEIQKYPGMQAADLLAYESFRHLDNKHFQSTLKPEWKERVAMKVLQRKLNKNHNCGYFDAEGLANLSGVREGWDNETMTSTWRGPGYRP